MNKDLELSTLRRDVQIMTDALQHAQNALMDYIPTLEKHGASLNYGRKVLGLINAALRRTSDSASPVTNSSTGE